VNRIAFGVMVLSALAIAAPPKECIQWFTDANIDPKDANCVDKCGITATGMNSFMCPQACPQLCVVDGKLTNVLGRLLYYPGLTPEEREIVGRFPKDALIVFRQKEIAELATEKIFKRDAQKDESDAFRYFLWAGLLSKELGPDKAKLFLDAHESAGRADDPDRAMDLANNRAGLLAAEGLRKKGVLSQDGLEKAAMIEIRTNRLVILKSQGLK
jgi:hypothetical protein